MLMRRILILILYPYHLMNGLDHHTFLFDFLYFLRENKEQTEQLANEYEMIETADTVRFLEQLPYTLTKAQKKVWAEIRSDLNSHYCMNRLVQGDVGSGKTIIAVLALLMCVSNGYQGAMMAPT